jgi:hypothetical protein
VSEWGYDHPFCVHLPPFSALTYLCCASAKSATEYERDLIARISSDRVARREKDTRQRKQAVDQARVQTEVRVSRDGCICTCFVAPRPVPERASLASTSWLFLPPHCAQAARNAAHAAEIQRYLELSRAERLAASQVADLRHRKGERLEQGKAWTERQQVRTKPPAQGLYLFRIRVRARKWVLHRWWPSDA